MSINQYLKSNSLLAEAMKQGYTMRIDSDKFSVGPKLKSNATEKQVLEKIRQIFLAWLLHRDIDNHENLPIFPKYEKKILTSPWASVVYAFCFLKKPWIIAEEIISKDKESSLIYSMKVLKGRFELGEKTISKNTEYSLIYCKEVMKRKKLPQHMHQSMILMGIKDPSDPYVKKYLKYKGVSGKV